MSQLFGQSRRAERLPCGKSFVSSIYGVAGTYGVRNRCINRGDLCLEVEADEATAVFQGVPLWLFIDSAGYFDRSQGTGTSR